MWNQCCPGLGEGSIHSTARQNDSLDMLTSKTSQLTEDKRHRCGRTFLEVKQGRNENREIVRVFRMGQGGHV